ncbi:uncharacterized protein E0L32_006458 [Thyridium curvatum]|uniref:Uncharacterized protein n=1 Tax=Thyridium curvatum TaxID=1093900 RepID=A0A507ASQ5_9PEZI|nr:uncharacterized protein E0L32_006458 [Thyridium curvatum]TPX13032.1 hypothetical protein E0L32_006458 [Thyridium curvatum]
MPRYISPSPSARSRHSYSRSPSHDRSRSRSRSTSSYTSSRHSRDGHDSRAGGIEGSSGKKESAVKTSLLFLGGVAAATYAAHKFWPKGITYGDKEEWEIEEKIERKRKPRRHIQERPGGPSSSRALPPPARDGREMMRRSWYGGDGDRRGAPVDERYYRTGPMDDHRGRRRYADLDRDDRSSAGASEVSRDWGRGRDHFAAGSALGRQDSAPRGAKYFPKDQPLPGALGPRPRRASFDEDPFDRRQRYDPNTDRGW